MRRVNSGRLEVHEAGKRRNQVGLGKNKILGERTGVEGKFGDEIET